MGDEEISDNLFKRLQNDLISMKSTISEMISQYADCTNLYNNEMRNSVPSDGYTSENGLWEMHRRAKNAAIEEVLDILFNKCLLIFS